ncbi:type II toxin-antitoxin system Phd/YefM family antitoxin [Albibacillus kandeliae]|uniref:type II toxin-antitoxin system Phd/YefM family antitoxin n=1 Tax=Albibacillus kandeliae TaxID=2174228 RepID=UPI000D68CE63|nr:type II toxin-antitoxin system prevent-host-death family antitoxin [Albibacillus kandeliae]
MQGVEWTEKTYTATEARKNFADLIDAAHFGEKIVVQKRDRRVAVVSMEFMERVERLLRIEAALEAEAAQKSLDEFYEKGGKTMEEIEQELGMG